MNLLNKALPVLLIALFLTATPSIMAMNISFSNPIETRNWYISNDTVMGGVSSSNLRLVDSVLRFSGNLRLENNGGFASTWRGRDDLNMNSSLPIKLSARGDGRTYQIRLRMTGAERISYKAEFTVNEEWTDYQFSAVDFIPVWRGRAVMGAPAMDFSRVVSVGFLLGDKQPGPFSVEVRELCQHC